MMRLPGLHRRTDEALLAATARSGAAFGEFYDRYERPVLVFMRRRTKSPELAADLTAEVFAAALEGADAFSSQDGAPASAWIFAIARNVLISSYRHAKVDDDARRRLAVPALALEDNVLEHLERVVMAEDGEEALAGLERLPPDQREAIRQHVLEERSYVDIAADLRCSTAVIRQRVSRGLTTLRNEVQHP